MNLRLITLTYRAPIAFALGALLLVKIDGMKFDPPALQAHVGDTVRWTNSDLVPHTVTGTSKVSTSKSGPLNSKIIEGGKSFDFTFKKAGTYKYKCSYHPTMFGEVTVK